MIYKKVLYMCAVTCDAATSAYIIQSPCRAGYFCLPCARASGKACVHNILKARCSICDGRALCPHLKLRGAHKSNPKPLLYYHPTPPNPSPSFLGMCKVCNCDHVCPHGKWQDDCLACGGCNWCQHAQWKATCRLCNGSVICPHGCYFSACEHCGGSR